VKSHRLPVLFIITVVLLIGFCLATFYTASLAERYTLGHFGSYYSFFKRILFLLGISLVVAALLQFINYRAYKYLIGPVYAVQTVLLVAVLFVGRGAYGAKRWLGPSGAGFQPSEIQKLVIIVLVALLLSIPEKKLRTGLRVLLIVAVVLPSAYLVYKEPDLGTTSLLLGISIVMIIHFRLTGKQLLILALVLAVAATGIWFKLTPEQHSRIETFLNPQADPLGTGYNVIQSKVATGSGGLLGRGVKGSTQTALSFVPMQYADFVFSLVGELFGFVGCTILVLLFVLLLWSTFLIYRTLTDDFARYIIIGIETMWFLQAAINMGMAIGLSPVTGIPLPFISYGGSSMLVQVAAASVVVNIYRTRDELRF